MRDLLRARWCDIAHTEVTKRLVGLTTEVRCARCERLLDRYIDLKALLDSSPPIEETS